MRKPKPDDSTTRTAAELRVQIRALQEKRAAVLAMRQKDYAVSKGSVAHIAPGMTWVQQRAAQLLGGDTPTASTMGTLPSRDYELAQEQAAIDLALVELNGELAKAVEREEAALVAAMAPAWRELCRETTLLIVKLSALEERARQMRDRAPGSGADFVMGQYIGGAFSILGVGDPLKDMREAAVSAGIATAAEIRNASNV